MRRISRLIAVTILGPCSLAPEVRADARIEFIEVGTPRNGDLVMSGWRGVIIRGMIDDKPITEFYFGSAGPETGFIFGNMAQRWTDPTGQGNYTVTSPGPHPANNSFDSDFNFDSHFLGTPQMYDVTSIGETSLSGFYPQRSGIPSDGFVGYGATLPKSETDPFLYGQGTHISGRMRVLPEFQSNSIDIAYVVVDGPFSIFGDLLSGQQEFFVTANYPEPSSVGLLAVSSAVVLLRRSRRNGGGAPSTVKGFGCREAFRKSPANPGEQGCTQITSGPRHPSFIGLHPWRLLCNPHPAKLPRILP